MRRLLTIIATTLVLLAVSCSDSEQFRVNGTIEGKPTMNLRVGYYADGAYRTLITAAREGEFEFFGRSASPAVLEIMDYDYRPLARLLVKNGETYEVTADPKNRFNVRLSGSAVNERWASFLKTNGADLAAGSMVPVESYVGEHPDDVLSTVLLITEYNSAYDPESADSLMNLIAPSARPSALTEAYNHMLQHLVTETALGPVSDITYLDRSDSLRSFSPAAPYSVIVFSTIGAARSDSVVPAVKRLFKAKDRHPAVLDILLDTDTAMWKRGTRPDSAQWAQGWLPGGLAAPGVSAMGVSALPFYIVCDSTGRQLYRGRHAAVASAVAAGL